MTGAQVRQRLDELPHLVRLRLAARCARQSLLLFDAAWPAASAARRLTVSLPVELCERAATGESVVVPQDAWLQAVMTAGVANMWRTCNPSLKPSDGPFPADPQAAIVASLAANAVAAAARVAGQGEGRSADNAFESYKFTLNAAGAAAVDVCRLVCDLTRELQSDRNRRPWWRRLR